jgi:ketosteroid isomerase-like protein
MSEQQNVTLIQKLFEAFGRGDVQTILDYCTNDCEFYCPGPSSIPYAGTKKGRAEIQGYFEALIGTQRNANLSIDQFVSQDDTVVAIGRYTAKVNSTGKPIDTPVVTTFKVQNGKITRHMVIGDTAALAASYTAAAAAAS